MHTVYVNKWHRTKKCLFKFLIKWSLINHLVVAIVIVYCIWNTQTHAPESHVPTSNVNLWDIVYCAAVLVFYLNRCFHFNSGECHCCFTRRPRITLHIHLRWTALVYVFVWDTLKETCVWSFLAKMCVNMRIKIDKFNILEAFVLQPPREWITSCFILWIGCVCLLAFFSVCLCILPPKINHSVVSYMIKAILIMQINHSIWLS